MTNYGMEWLNTLFESLFGGDAVYGANGNDSYYGKDMFDAATGSNSASGLTATTPTEPIVPDDANTTTANDGNLMEWLNGLFSSTGDIIQENQEYNAIQAQANREWLQHMSDTSYQRAVADLKSAGLNPLLAVSGGFSPAVTPNSSAATSNNVTGETFTQLLSVVATVFGSLVNAAPNVFGDLLSSLLGQTGKKSIGFGS